MPKVFPPPAQSGTQSGIVKLILFICLMSQLTAVTIACIATRKGDKIISLIVLNTLPILLTTPLKKSTMPSQMPTRKFFIAVNFSTKKFLILVSFPPRKLSRKFQTRTLRFLIYSVSKVNTALIKPHASLNIHLIFSITQNILSLIQPKTLETRSRIPNKFQAQAAPNAANGPATKKAKAVVIPLMTL